MQVLLEYYHSGGTYSFYLGTLSNAFVTGGTMTLQPLNVGATNYNGRHGKFTTTSTFFWTAYYP